MPEILNGYSRLKNSERHHSTDAKLLGPADEKEMLKVTIIVRRRPDAAPLPESDYFLNPPSQRRGLSENEFAVKYGASDEDLAKVSEFAREHQLNIIETNAARRTVIVSGNIAQMDKAFGVELGRYEHKVVHHRGQKPEIEMYRGRDGFIHIPDALQDIVEGVFGLDNRNITKRNGADPPNITTLSTQTIRDLYNFPANSAAGQTIGIVSVSNPNAPVNQRGGYKPDDINATFGGNPPTITDVSINGIINSLNTDGETTQDICIAGLAAPGAAIAVYFQDGSEQGWIDMLNKIAHPTGSDPVCSVISSSFYICDGDDDGTLSNEGISKQLVNHVSSAFYDATILGRVTVCVASGDTGSSSKVGGNPSAWHYPFAADGKAHIQYPASDPSVLAVGGTTIGNVNGATFDEYVWNDPDPTDPKNWGTTGGGISEHFDLPSYQNGIEVPKSVNDNHAGRGVPDVAANASINSGYSGISVGGQSFTGNGTSASSPLWAGLIAVINAALGENVGFANPAIYAMGSSVFRDIVPGEGPTDNSNSGVKGYPAHPGWDACTGWGSINGNALLTGLQKIYHKKTNENLIEYDNPDNGIKIEYPQEWIRRDNKQNPVVTFTSSDGNVQLQISTTNYSVANIPSSADIYAGDALSSYENPGSSGLANFKFLGGGKLNLSTDSEIIAPPDAYLIEYSYTDPQFGPNQKMEVFIVSNSPYILFDLEFSSSPNNFSLYKDTFDEMVNSFRIAYV